MQSTSVRFSESVRVISVTARAAGLEIPVFRSPPQRTECDRTLRQGHNGEVVVAVRIAGRPFAAVQSDLIEGLLISNGLVGPAGEAHRRGLWNALARAGQVEGPPALAAA